MANVIESEATRFWLTDHCPDADEFISTSSFPNHSMFTRNSVDSLGRDGAAVHVLFLRLIRYGVHQFALQDQFDAGTGVATIKLVSGSGSLHDRPNVFPRPHVLETKLYDPFSHAPGNCSPYDLGYPHCSVYDNGPSIIGVGDVRAYLMVEPLNQISSFQRILDIDVNNKAIVFDAIRIKITHNGGKIDFTYIIDSDPRFIPALISLLINLFDRSCCSLSLLCYSSYFSEPGYPNYNLDLDTDTYTAVQSL